MTSQLKSLLVIALAIEVIVGQQAHSITKSVTTQSKTDLSEIAPVIKARTLEDKEVLINYSSVKRPTVLYLFSSSCTWCVRNWENVKTLAKNTNKTHRFIGLALNTNNLPEHIKTNQVKFPVYKQLSPEAISKLELGSTPQTIVISLEGKIMKNWVGAYNGRIQQEIETFFQVKLPEVSVQNSTDPQFCAYCIWNGLLNSPGAVVKVDGKQIRCKQNGKWTTPY